MSSTNKTTNYELSQFLGSDKPAWLTDYNQDMAKIDAGVHTAQSTATGANGKADANATNIGELTYLSTTAKNNLVAAINEVDGNADAAGNTAGAAATTANAAQATANSAIAGLQRFNLTNKISLTTSTDRGSINSTITNAQFAGDSTNSIFKVYGRVYISGLNGISGTVNVKIGDTPLRPTASYTINTAAIVYRIHSGGTSDVVPRNITVNTDGTITYSETISGNIESLSIMLPPCLYFNTDFGDE